MIIQAVKSMLYNSYSKLLVLPTASYTTFGHVLIGGGTGFIGSNLREVLIRENYKVTIVSRVKTGEEHIITWADIIKNGIPRDVTAVVNLTGEPIMTPLKYFGNKWKNRIWISRVGSTTLLADIISHMECKPNVIITVTSTDMYPPNEIHTENFHPTDSSKNNFFTKLGFNWENACKCVPNEVRQVSIRAGTVLGHDGGFIKWLNYTTYMGLGSKLGDGCQFQPWIHMCDLVYLILFAIENKEIIGKLNGVSPETITNGQLTTGYAQLLRRPIRNIPPIALKTLYGTERTKLLLEGRKVLPTRTLSYGFSFKYCKIEEALEHLLCCKN